LQSGVLLNVFFSQHLEDVMLTSSLQSVTLAIASKSVQSLMMQSSLLTSTSDECFKQGLQNVTLPSSLQPLTFGECFD
jgi:hypothetical protein